LTQVSSTLAGRFGAILLAAGMSRRMGTPKALLDLDGQPLIARLIETVRSALPLSRIIVVTGHNPQQVRDACLSTADRNLSFVHNANYEHGEMLSSVKAGVNAVRDEWEGFFLMLLDQPLVRVSTLTELAKNWLAERPDIVIPTVAKKRGHPLLIASRCVCSIVSLPGDATLREFVAQHASTTRAVEVDDPGVVSDVDTPDDYQRILQQWRTQSCPTEAGASPPTLPP
jgi:molybdenum cofactor cytidylyltransferase